MSITLLLAKTMAVAYLADIKSERIPSRRRTRFIVPRLFLGRSSQVDVFLNHTSSCSRASARGGTGCGLCVSGCLTQNHPCFKISVSPLTYRTHFSCAASGLLSGLVKTPETLINRSFQVENCACPTDSACSERIMSTREVICTLVGKVG